jgi:hypothetical protein
MIANPITPDKLMRENDSTIVHQPDDAKKKPPINQEAFVFDN